LLIENANLKKYNNFLLSEKTYYKTIIESVNETHTSSIFSDTTLGENDFNLMLKTLTLNDIPFVGNSYKSTSQDSYDFDSDNILNNHEKIDNDDISSISSSQSNNSSEISNIIVSENSSDNNQIESEISDVDKVYEIDKSNLSGYQLLYDKLYSEKPKNFSIPNLTNNIYLTFDDGPSNITNEILDILKEKNVKATFFVVGSQGKNFIKTYQRIVEEGHSIGIHTYTHKYKEIYSSVEEYLLDFNKIYNLIYDYTGVHSDIFRFPGGSINSYNTNIYNELIIEMNRRGFTYYDWSVSSGDSTGSSSYNKEFVKRNVIDSVVNKNNPIVLMHDTANKKPTLEALPEIIDELMNKGYNFLKITNETKPIVFGN